MGKPLRVLMVEDSEDDALLVLRELRAAGYDLTHARVDTAAALVAALDRHPWDLVIGDYSMPHFSGTAALAVNLDMARDVYADAAERQRLVERDTYSDRQYDNVEATWKRRDGRLLTVQLSVRAVRNAAGRVDYYETFVRDVTDQRRLQQQVLQSQKMEAVGRLAGGVAHDFNNLLTVITSYSDLLLEDLAPGDAKRDDLEQVRKAADGAAALTRQLLAFSRQQVVEPRVVSLNTVVEGLQKILRRVIGEDIEVTIALAPDLGAVRADVGQLEQVLMNLAVNARDAMPKGGRPPA